MRGEVERKALLQQAAVLVGDDEAEADRGGEREQARKERFGDRQRQRVVEGDRGTGDAATIMAVQASAALSGLNSHAAAAASAANRAEIRKLASGPGSTTALREIRLLTAVA